MAAAAGGGRGPRGLVVVLLLLLLLLLLAAGSVRAAGAASPAWREEEDPSASSDCGRLPTCALCTARDACAWIPSRYSCAPADAAHFFPDLDRTVGRSCANVTDIETFPAPEFRHQCERGGVLVDWARTDVPPGAACDCANGMVGSKCQVCRNADNCASPGDEVAAYRCDQTLKNIPEGATRELSCTCTSPFCGSINFGPGKGIVNVQFKNTKANKEYSAVIDILQSAPRPTNRSFSPFLLKAHLSQCTQGVDMKCSAVCGSSKCDLGTVWTNDDYCRVWDCTNKDANSDEEVSCAPDGEPNAGECAIIRAFIAPPMQFVCIIPTRGSERSMAVEGKIKCGFATKSLKHPSITLDCDIGTCVPQSVTVAPTPWDERNGSSPDADHGGDSTIFSCSGRYGDQRCFAFYYLLILALPTVLTGAVFWGARAHDREILRSSMIIHPRRSARVTNIDLESALVFHRMDRSPNAASSAASQDQQQQPSSKALELEAFADDGEGSSSQRNTTTTTTTPTTTTTANDDDRALGEEDAFIQAPLPANTPVATASPVLSFFGISFAIAGSLPSRRTPTGRHSRAPRVSAVAQSVLSQSIRRPQSFRTVLHSVSGHVKPGEMCALLGPSGSGKTSLLDILAGRKNVGRVSGSITLGSTPVLDASDLRARVGYVTQDDVLPATSTVNECLLFHSRLRGDCTAPLSLHYARVTSVVEELNLAPCRFSFIGGSDDKSLSGGEKRRVTIAVELLSLTTEILMLDEPTSGLDSNSTAQVIQALRAIKEKERKSVILSIHQPSSALFRSFDRIILLSCTGRCLYCGPAATLEVFFGAFPSGCNPAEFLIDICAVAGDDVHRETQERFDSSAIRADQVVELRMLTELASSSLTTTTPPHARARHRSSWKRQCAELCVRSLRQTYRHPTLALTNVLATVCVGVGCGMLYQGVTNDLQGAINRAGLFFFFLCFLMLASLADLAVFHEERLMLMRERASGTYTASAYFVSKVFAELLPLRLLPLCITCFLLTFLVGLNHKPSAVLAMYLILLGVSLCATLQFLAIGMVFAKPGTGNFVSVLLTMFSLLMSGFLLQFDGTGGGNDDSQHPPANSTTSGFEWMQKLSVLHFGFEALLVNEMHGVDYHIVIKAEDGTETTRATVSGDLIMAQIGVRNGHFSEDVGMVVLFCIACSCLCLLLLEYVVFERR